MPPSRGKRLCGAFAVGLGLIVAGLFLPEAVKNKDILGDPAVGALPEGITVPVAYTLCYRIT